MRRADLKSKHERSVLQSFARYLAKEHADLEVLSYPDPPDAIIELNGSATWVEITDAYESEEWAKHITSYPAEDKPTTTHETQLIKAPDLEACERVLEVILKKYSKDSMKEIYGQRGQGILLVGAYTPLTMPEQIAEQSAELIAREVETRPPIFASIYLYRNSIEGHSFTRLL